MSHSHTHTPNDLYLFWMSIWDCHRCQPVVAAFFSVTVCEKFLTENYVLILSIDFSNKQTTTANNFEKKKFVVVHRVNYLFLFFWINIVGIYWIYWSFFSLEMLWFFLNYYSSRCCICLVFFFPKKKFSSVFFVLAWLVPNNLWFRSRFQKILLSSFVCLLLYPSVCVCVCDKFRSEFFLLLFVWPIKYVVFVHIYRSGTFNHCG